MHPSLAKLNSLMSIGYAGMIVVQVWTLSLQFAHNAKLHVYHQATMQAFRVSLSLAGATSASAVAAATTRSVRQTAPTVARCCAAAAVHHNALSTWSSRAHRRPANFTRAAAAVAASTQQPPSLCHAQRQGFSTAARMVVKPSSIQSWAQAEALIQEHPVV